MNEKPPAGPAPAPTPAATQQEPMNVDLTVDEPEQRLDEEGLGARLNGLEEQDRIRTARRQQMIRGSIGPDRTGKKTGRKRDVLLDDLVIEQAYTVNKTVKSWVYCVVCDHRSAGPRQKNRAVNHAIKCTVRPLHSNNHDSTQPDSYSAAASRMARAGYACGNTGKGQLAF